MVGPDQSTPSFVRLAAHPLRWRLLRELGRSDLRVRELVRLVDEPQNLVSYHLRLLRTGGLVAATRSSFDRRDSYYRLDLERCAHALAETAAALHPALAGQLDRAVRWSGPVLFICTGNSARSPIAEALLRHRTDGRIEVASAGTNPKAHMHPNAVRVLGERHGITVTIAHPRQLDPSAGRRFKHIITLCDKAREACDSITTAHWSIADPATAGVDDLTTYPAFQRTADEIDTRIRHLLPTLANHADQEVTA